MKLKLKLNRKGQLAELSSLAVGIAVLTITLVIAFLIMGQGKEQTIELTSATSYNSTKTIVVDSFTAFGECIPDEGMSVSEVRNGSKEFDVILETGNYTVLLNTINVSDDALGAGATALSTSVNMTYSCRRLDEAYNSTSTLQNATSDIPGWIPLIVVALIGAVLIGLVSRFRS